MPHAVPPGRVRGRPADRGRHWCRRRRRSSSARRTRASTTPRCSASPAPTTRATSRSSARSRARPTREAFAPVHVAGGLRGPHARRPPLQGARGRRLRQRRQLARGVQLDGRRAAARPGAGDDDRVRRPTSRPSNRGDVRVPRRRARRDVRVPRRLGRVRAVRVDRRRPASSTGTVGSITYTGIVGRHAHVPGAARPTARATSRPRPPPGRGGSPIRRSRRRASAVSS